MPPDDEELETNVDTGDEELETGTGGDGTGGEDEPRGDEDTEISAEQPSDGGDAGEPPPAPARQPAREQRGSDRIQRLVAEQTTLRNELEQLKRERQQWQNNQQQQTEQQERERVALMNPEERAEYRITQYERRTEQRLRQSELNNQAAMDKASYDATAASNPTYKRYSAEVERMFAEQMAKGAPVDRTTILKHILGAKALEGAAQAPRQRRAANTRVERERVIPSTGKGDQQRPSTRRMSTAEERLKDVLI
jgi:hypothetical protein